MKSFEEFQASGQDVNCIGSILSDESLMGVAGRIYADDFVDYALYIRRDGDKWATDLWMIDDNAKTLEDFERGLYDFAIEEGYIDDEEDT